MLNSSVECGRNGEEMREGGIEMKKIRSDYSFANINFLGKCNLDCNFCLGKDLENEFNTYNHMDTHYLLFKDLNDFLCLCWNNGIRQLYLTGQNTDPLLYPYLDDFIKYLKKWGFFVGIRTNGLLAQAKMEIVNTCNTCKGDAVAYTLLTLDREDMRKMTNVGKIPDWDYIFTHTTVPYRVSIMVTDTNFPYIFSLIGFISAYKFRNNNLRYIQLRRVSTEYRKLEMKENIIAFKSVEDQFKYIKIKKSYENANIYELGGVDVVLWKTVDTTANSMNYFTNGVISDEYYIIKGYEKYKK